MKLFNIINSNNWLSIELTLLQLYPDQKRLIHAYRSVFENLKSLNPKENKMRIVLSEEDCDFENEYALNTYIDISGQDDTKDEYGNIISYAIEFTEWKKWLGMDIAPDTLRNFSELEIISHCLYEMTFIGYDEAEIQEERKSLENTLEEFQNLNNQVKKQKTISFEELKKRLEE
ncbi:DUF6557 family protein [Marivirga sp.]|uniref:DUF6557 family protein n=1 Tax=Marivirga sp. TaxID=2018662 RepID=UPI0025DBC956|nr:DUF6557 family protein [Marivirga sp.]